MCVSQCVSVLALKSEKSENDPEAMASAPAFSTRSSVSVCVFLLYVNCPSIIKACTVTKGPLSSSSELINLSELRPAVVGNWRLPLLRAHGFVSVLASTQSFFP